MSKRFETAGAPSQRQLRVGESIRHAIAEVLARGDLHDATIARHVISVTEVRLSPDLKIATVFFMPLGGKAETDVLKALAANAYQLRKDVAKRVNLKFAPDLRFRIDNSFGEANRIDRLLDDESVRRDTGIAPRIGMVGHATQSGTGEPGSDEETGR